MAHWTVRCTRPYNSKPATLGNSRARSTIIHRTVWCATGLSGEPPEQRLSAPTVDSDRKNSATQYYAEVRAAKSEGHRTVRCRKRTKPPTVDQLQTLTDTLTWRAPNSARCLFGGAPYCPVRPSPAASPTATKVVGGYKYPSTITTTPIQAFQTSHSIQEQKTSLQDTSNRLNPL